MRISSQVSQGSYKAHILPKNNQLLLAWKSRDFNTYLITSVNTNIYPIIYLISYWFQAPNPFPFVTLSPQTINDSGYIFQGRVSPLNNEHYQPRMSVNKSKVAS